MSETNIDTFNTYAAKIFDHLYSTFPKATEINYDEIVGELNQEHSDIFTGTLKFLKKEDYITYDRQVYNGKFIDVVLTAKGLSVLKAVPHSLDKKEPFIEKIRNALAGGGKEALKTTIQELISYTIKSAIGP